MNDFTETNLKTQAHCTNSLKNVTHENRVKKK